MIRFSPLVGVFSFTRLHRDSIEALKRLIYLLALLFGWLSVPCKLQSFLISQHTTFCVGQL